MTFARLLIVVGVITVPTWYAYRSKTDANYGVTKWNKLWQEMTERKKSEGDDQTKQNGEASAFGWPTDCNRQVDHIDALRVSVIDEQKRWSDVDKLMHSEAGLALAKDQLYLRRVDRLYTERLSDEALRSYGDRIQKLRAICTARHASSEIDTLKAQNDLTSLQAELESWLKQLRTNRKQILELYLYATNQLPNDLDGKIRAWRVANALSLAW